jgi:hypothetical protein
MHVLFDITLSYGVVMKTCHPECLTHASFLLGLLFDLEGDGDIFLRNVISLNGVISQKIILFYAYFNDFGKIH